MEGSPRSVCHPEPNDWQVGNTSIVEDLRASDKEPASRKSMVSIMVDHS